MRDSDRFMPIADRLDFSTRVICLGEHDLVPTGTLAGAGNLVVGLEVEIKYIGTLKHPVAGR